MSVPAVKGRPSASHGKSRSAWAAGEAVAACGGENLAERRALAEPPSRGIRMGACVIRRRPAQRRRPARTAGPLTARDRVERPAWGRDSRAASRAGRAGRAGARGEPESGPRAPCLLFPI